MNHNEYGQPVGDPVDWRPREPIAALRETGTWCTVEPLAPEHDEALGEALLERSPGSIWTYLPVGGFAPDDAGRRGLRSWLEGLRAGSEAVPHVIAVPGRGPLGLASYLRVDGTHGSVEIGGIVLAEALQRSTAATEAMFLLMRHAFETAGYRRYEWKCDALNRPSRQAATRLGFRYEGTFRQAIAYKGRNRDTAWFSVLDGEWPRLRPAFEAWLAPENFDERGRQRSRLAIDRRPSTETGVPDAGTGGKLS